MGLRLQANASLVVDEAEPEPEPEPALTGRDAASVMKRIRGKSRRSFLSNDVLK